MSGLVSRFTLSQSTGGRVARSAHPVAAKRSATHVPVVRLAPAAPKATRFQKAPARALVGAGALNGTSANGEAHETQPRRRVRV